MKTAYINYAMSVIIGRALPDARDGLKPVHRRCYTECLKADIPLKRNSVNLRDLVGEVMGKYHPHGDQSNLRYHGENGTRFLTSISIDRWSR